MEFLASQSRMHFYFLFWDSGKLGMIGSKVEVTKEFSSPVAT